MSEMTGADYANILGEIADKTKMDPELRKIQDANQEDSQELVNSKPVLQPQENLFKFDTLPEAVAFILERYEGN